MINHYLETRGRVHFMPANMAADIMRHLQARQHMGKAVIVCDNPAEFITVARKQWLKLSRSLQKRRGFTSNAVEILKYTYTITQMQQMRFVAAAPYEEPGASAYFITPKQLKVVPPDCFSLYIATILPADVLGRLTTQLPHSALLIDYTSQLEGGDFGLKLKSELEHNVAISWQVVEAFLQKHRIEAAKLSQAPAQSEIMDDALDTLLGVGSEFLAVASMFQRALDLARPLRNIPKSQRDRYEVFIMLAHRVQTFAPGALSSQFLHTYADDSFFLQDAHHETETLAEAMARHLNAGRMNLVRALVLVDQEPPARRAFVSA